jgi:cell division protein FtsI/penicillin-binding protein 2
MMELANDQTAAAFTDGMDEIFDCEHQTDESVVETGESHDASEVSVSEAAKLLGITERSVWRRIRQKKLAHKLVGGKAIVTIRQSDVSERKADTSEQLDVDVSDVSVEVDRTSEVVRSTSDYLNLIAELSHKLEAANYRNGYLEAQLDNYREQVKLIPDLQGAAIKAEVQSVKLAELEAALEGYKSGRWSRFCRWFLGQR